MVKISEGGGERAVEYILLRVINIFWTKITIKVYKYLNIIQHG